MGGIIKVLFLVFLLFTFSGATQVKVGKTSIVLKTTDNFQEVSGDYSYIFDMFKLFTPHKNQLLGVFLTKKDYKALTLNKIPKIEKYLLVETLKEDINKDITFEKFQERISFIKSQNLSFESKDNKHFKLIEKQIASNIKLGQEMPLGIYLDKKDALGFGRLIRYSKNNQASLTLAVSNYLKIKNKILIVYLFQHYSNEEDIKKAEITSKEIVKSILEANSL